MTWKLHGPVTDSVKWFPDVVFFFLVSILWTLSESIVNGVDGLKALLKFNRSLYYLLLSSFMQICAPSSPRVHCIFTQTTIKSNRTWTPTRTIKQWTSARLSLADGVDKCNGHVATKVHNSCINPTQG